MSHSREWHPALSDLAGQRIVNRLIRDSRRQPHTFLENAQLWITQLLDHPKEASVTLNRVAFFLSVLLDQVAWGATLAFSSSQIRLVVPQIGHVNNSASDINRNRLAALRGRDSQFRPDVSMHQALQLLKEGTPVLERASAGNPEVMGLFASGITTWSMPYRGREGRSARFVLFIEDESYRVPMGLIEIGDDAPLNPLRDRALGLEVPVDESQRLRFADRLKAFRECIRPEGLRFQPQRDLLELVVFLGELRKLGQGRSGGEAEVAIGKRYAYLYRLVAGEAALRGVVSDEFAHHGVRAARDILLTRVHGEITICGALPPFGSVLGGKLVSSFIAHPELRRSLDTTPGVILGKTFDLDKLGELMPTGGPLYLTTKGLYAAHSAQYNRIRVTTNSGSLEALKKIGVTAGQTTSHLSDMTTFLASMLDGQEGRLGVSKLYGSGGGKRHRLLQRAASDCGLPPAMIFAEVRRPVYGLRLASNVSEVTLFGDKPEWLFGGVGTADDGEYTSNAISLWRSSFLDVASRRLERMATGEVA